MGRKQALAELPPGSLGKSSVFVLAVALVTSVACKLSMGRQHTHASGAVSKLKEKERKTTTEKMKERKKERKVKGIKAARAV